jgi:predicted ribosomally synthesized peptide with nif11-like leader
MSAAGTKALFERVSSDEAFKSRLEAAATPEDKRRIVAEAGFDVSPEDLPSLRDLAGVEELSDEDLEKVAGGTGTNTGAGSAIGVVVVIGAVAAALA